MQSAEPIARALRRLAAAGCLLAAGRAAAVLFDATGAASHNTNAPAGALANSGWQYQGRFGPYLGTAIAPHHFLTAWHVNHANTNWVFVLDGTNYHPTAASRIGESDLNLWRVAERLPRYAPVYTGSGEVGLPTIVFGRGTQRGNPVVTDGLTNGWLWGADTQILRWGSNQVAAIEHDSEGNPYLRATFDHGAGAEECHLSGGDSGGGAFVLAGGVWQLAGVHYTVDGPYYLSDDTNSAAHAAVYDRHGLYHWQGGNLVSYGDHDPGAFYSSRVSARYDWLTNAIPDFDSDADGMPDWWEKQHAGDIHGLSPTNDPDHDGFDNLAEWTAQTDPTNAASFFRIAAMARTGTVATLTFEGRTNRQYRAWVRPPPLSATGAWNAVGASPFAGAGGPTSWLDTNAVATARFYRVTVALPP
jgi:hypothetical protein